MSCSALFLQHKHIYRCKIPFHRAVSSARIQHNAIPKKENVLSPSTKRAKARVTNKGEGDEDGRTREVQNAFEEVAKQLHIHNMGDWQDVPKYLLDQFASISQKRLITNNGEHNTMLDILSDAFPAHPWDTRQLSYDAQKQFPQRFMERIVRSIFPHASMQRNRRDFGIRSAAGAQLEIDLFLPALNLGFEYQDKFHYFKMEYGNCQLLDRQEADAHKKEQAAQKGITIISVPFWWNFDQDSLTATILQDRPDLVKSVSMVTKKRAEPISQEIPQNVLDKYNTDIPGIGSLMIAIQMSHSADFDPTGWLVFEKYDGIRAVFHPDRQQFFSRFGNVFPLPQYIAEGIPRKYYLDGEIYFGRGKILEAMKISSRAEFDVIDWDNFRAVFFDIVEHTQSYVNRYHNLVEMFSARRSEHPYLSLAPAVVCRSRSHLDDLQESVVQYQSGEGLIIRRLDALYRAGQSKNMCKYKGYKDDEAMFIHEIVPRLWMCRIPTIGQDSPLQYIDTQLLVDEDFKENLAQQGIYMKYGDIVSYKYYGHRGKHGLPLNAKIFRLRKDITWDQVMNNYNTKPVKERYTGIWKKAGNSWGLEANRKRFFDEMAENVGFDPKDAAGWYKVTTSSVLKIKGGSAVLEYYEGSFIKALTALYPSLNLKRENFVGVPVNDWTTAENRKNYFKDFSVEMGFNYSDKEKWYTFTKSDFMNKGGHGLLDFYGGSHIRALIDVFPELNLERDKFVGLTKKWTLPQRRQFFDSLAIQTGFDPCVSQNWASVTHELIKERGGDSLVGSHYNNNFTKALSDIYPELFTTPQTSLS